MLADAVIWRYMDVAKYVSLLSRGLLFSQPSQLGDPWEGCWSVGDVIQFRDANWGKDVQAVSAEWRRRFQAKQESLDGFGISCWHRSESESAALWAIYMPRGLGVAIQCTVNGVLASLAPAGREIRCLDVEYVDYKEPLGDDPLVLLSRKRLEFWHEKEVRFAVALRQDERDAIGDWRLLLQDRSKRHLTLSPVGSSLVRTGVVPGRLVTDPTLNCRATPAGVYLQTDNKVLIQRVHLAPGASWALRHAVISAAEAFGLDPLVVGESNADLVPPDVLEFD
jgi:hypothetical protein